MIKLAIIGARGIPANYGGFETFAEELSVNLVEKYPYDLAVVCDAEQKAKNNGLTEFKGIKLLYSKYSKAKNPLLFYFDSMKVAKQYPIIYSCGPGVGVFAWMKYFNGNTLITNPDGLNWKRAKWNKLVQTGFRTFEFLSARFSDYMACDSVGIEKHIKSSYGHDQTFVAEYGAYVNPYLEESDAFFKDILSEYKVEKDNYHLIVSRLEPENNVDIIIEGYSKKKRKYPLLVVGNILNTKFTNHIQAIASDQVYFVGGIYDRKKLNAVRAASISYFHGHSVGGTNPSLLEAMGSENLCICHDNVFTREVVGENGFFFDTPDSVSIILDKVESDPIVSFSTLKLGVLNKVKNYYNWDDITRKYHEKFVEIAENGK